MGIEYTCLPSNIVWESMDGKCSDRGRMAGALSFEKVLWVMQVLWLGLSECGIGSSWKIYIIVLVKTW
jgi:hypothetical protein